ncbi:hypothetical protein JCM7686_2541 [Paracoccus aminophilus JCM 7686]|uniref:Transglycosylase SLT domain-containing protein n=2 Tax=Paracoccus aminophilus TaxID=34003 RepID=S5XQG3_PARAH|nr:hypothetical protein JCM7686_2541 [Paracoccus aminophilus JCM 7686]
MLRQLIQFALTRPYRPVLGLAALVALLIAPGLARAQAAGPAEVCEWAAMQASRETGVPPDILMTLTLTETGRKLNGALRPWAWSVNVGGEGHWFEDPQSAIRFVEDRVAQGQSNLDLGCFQLNWRWHSQNFTSATQMFDPLENARYAARFVSDLYLESGNWRMAAGNFHSRTQVYSDRYLARFDTLRRMVQDGDYDGLSPPAAYNTFAAVDTRRRGRVPRERVMLLGAPLGSEVSGITPSLAVFADRPDRPLIGATGALIDMNGRGALIGNARAALIGARAPPDLSDLPELAEP